MESSQAMQTSRPRIIVADTDRFMRESICMGLGAGFETVQASSGGEVMSLFRSTPVDAMLLDASCRGIEGIQICAAVRDMQGGALMPIYITGDDDEDDLLRQAFDAGATDFLLKPVHLGLLARRIRRDLGTVALIGGSAVNSTDRSQAESELFRILPEPAILVGSKGVIFSVNDAFERVFARRASVGGMQIKELLSGVDAGVFEKEPYVYTEMNCQGRGRVLVRVHHIALVSGPWRGCNVFFLTEHSQVDAAHNGVLHAHGASVIVLEDYDVVARSIKRLLEKAGHRVSVAASADEAVAMFKETLAHGDVYDLAILDIAIPGSAGGEDVLKLLRTMMPALPAIVTSGAWNDPAMSNPSEHGFDASLRKPFTRDELMSVINRALARHRK
jgi:CheY-like chemotaxis protein